MIGSGAEFGVLCPAPDPGCCMALRQRKTRVGLSGSRLWLSCRRSHALRAVAEDLFPLGLTQRGTQDLAGELRPCLLGEEPAQPLVATGYGASSGQASPSLSQCDVDCSCFRF